MKVDVSKYTTNKSRILSAIVIAPILTAVTLYVACIIGLLISEIIKNDKFGLSQTDARFLVVAAIVVAIIAGLCTMVFGLPLHLYLAKRNNMRAKYYCFVGAAMTAPMLLIYATGETEGVIFGLVFLFSGLLCAWLFWFIAVDTQYYPIRRAIQQGLTLFE